MLAFCAYQKRLKALKKPVPEGLNGTDFFLLREIGAITAVPSPVNRLFSWFEKYGESNQEKGSPVKGQTTSTIRLYHKFPVFPRETGKNRKFPEITGHQWIIGHSAGLTTACQLQPGQLHRLRCRTQIQGIFAFLLQPVSWSFRLVC